MQATRPPLELYIQGVATSKPQSPVGGPEFPFVLQSLTNVGIKSGFSVPPLQTGDSVPPFVPYPQPGQRHRGNSSGCRYSQKS